MVVAPPFPHRFQVPVTLVPTVQPFCSASPVMQCGNIASRTNGAGCIYIRNTHVPYIYIYICTYINK